MERRRAVVAAAAASLTFLLGAAGLTANAAILGSQPGGGVGQISPIAATISIPEAGRADKSATILPSSVVPTAPGGEADPATAAANPDEDLSTSENGSSGPVVGESPEPSATPAPPTAVEPTTRHDDTTVDSDDRTETETDEPDEPDETEIDEPDEPDDGSAVVDD